MPRGGGNTIDMVGRTFGRLTVLARAGATADRKALWLCRCACGAQVTARGRYLRSGATSSCGCVRAEMVARRNRDAVHDPTWRTHPVEYRTLIGMIRRCTDPSREEYQNYGGRGIAVCDRWTAGDGSRSGPQCFIDDMGPRPSPAHSIDRYPDNDGDYEPSNCRWATPSEQQRNKRRSRR